MPPASRGAADALGVIAGDLYRSRLRSPGDANMISNLKRLWREDEGATAVEYGLIVAAIAMTVVLIFMLIGNKANNTLNNVAAKFP